MAQDTPGAPGHDLLDDAIGRLAAMKTSVGHVLGRALAACHSRFLVFGSTLATLAAKVTDLEARDNISWPALEERIKALEERHAITVGNLAERLEVLEYHPGVSVPSLRASTTLLRAALQTLDPPVSAREPLRRRSDGT